MSTEDTLSSENCLSRCCAIMLLQISVTTDSVLHDYKACAFLPELKTFDFPPKKTLGNRVLILGCKHYSKGQVHG
jgi:hypothetical protein